MNLVLFAPCFERHFLKLQDLDIALRFADRHRNGRRGLAVDFYLHGFAQHGQGGTHAGFHFQDGLAACRDLF